MPCAPVSRMARASRRPEPSTASAMASRIAWSSALRLSGLEIVSRRTPSSGSSTRSRPAIAAGTLAPYSSTTSVSPSLTAWPSSQRISTTFPSSSASTGISIFMDSRITTVSPSSTLSPTWHSIFQTVPVMWASTSGTAPPPRSPDRHGRYVLDRRAKRRCRISDRVSVGAERGGCQPCGRAVRRASAKASPSPPATRSLGPDGAHGGARPALTQPLDARGRTGPEPRGAWAEDGTASAQVGLGVRSATSVVVTLPGVPEDRTTIREQSYKDPRPASSMARFHERSRTREPDLVYEIVRVLTALYGWTVFRARTLAAEQAGHLRPQPLQLPRPLLPRHGHPPQGLLHGQVAALRAADAVGLHARRGVPGAPRLRRRRGLRDRVG